MSPITLVIFVLGLAALIAGAEFLVRGASRLAAAFGISPLVIGLTVVAFRAVRGNRRGSSELDGPSNGSTTR